MCKIFQTTNYNKRGLSPKPRDSPLFASSRKITEAEKEEARFRLFLFKCGQYEKRQGKVVRVFWDRSSRTIRISDGERERVWRG